MKYVSDIKFKSKFSGCAIFMGLLWTYTIIAWIVNLVKFFDCDFVEPFKEEVLRGVGVFVPIVPLFTCWY